MTQLTEPDIGIPLFFQDAMDFPVPKDPVSLRGSLVLHLLAGFTPVIADSQLCDNASIQLLTPAGQAERRRGRRDARFFETLSQEQIQALGSVPKDLHVLLRNGLIGWARRDQWPSLLAFDDDRRKARVKPPNLPSRRYVQSLASWTTNAPLPPFAWSVDVVSDLFRANVLSRFEALAGRCADDRRIPPRSAGLVARFVLARKRVTHAELLELLRQPEKYFPDEAEATAELRASAGGVDDEIIAAYRYNVPTSLGLLQQFPLDTSPLALEVGEGSSFVARARTRGKRGVRTWVFDPEVLARLPAERIVGLRGSPGVAPQKELAAVAGLIQKWRRMGPSADEKILGELQEDCADAFEDYTKELEYVATQSLEPELHQAAARRARRENAGILVTLTTGVGLGIVSISPWVPYEIAAIAGLPSIALATAAVIRGLRSRTQRQQFDRIIGELPMTPYRPLVLSRG